MYTNAQYLNDMNGKTSAIKVEIYGVTSFVPLDPENSDYQHIMGLVDKGELVIAPAEHRE